MEFENHAYNFTKFPRSWEDIPSFTIPAEWHYRVAEVLVKEGAVIEAGTRLLTLDILEEEEEVNEHGQTNKSTLHPLLFVLSEAETYGQEREW
ncbi:hypothetical protein Tco_0826605 [Tanacetum coccineum]